MSNETAERSPDLPPPGRGAGDWYATRKATDWQCPQCGRMDRQRPDVCEYQPTIDHGRYEARKHSGWATHGWLVWWQCPQCGRDTFTVITAQRVAEWGCELGGWQRGA